MYMCTKQDLQTPIRPRWRSWEAHSAPFPHTTPEQGWASHSATPTLFTANKTKSLSWTHFSLDFRRSLDGNFFDSWKITPRCYGSFLGSNRHTVTKIKIISDNYKGANTVYTHSCPHKNNKKECFYVVFWKSENHIQVIIGKSFIFLTLSCLPG